MLENDTPASDESVYFDSQPFSEKYKQLKKRGEKKKSRKTTSCVVQGHS